MPGWSLWAAPIAGGLSMAPDTLVLRDVHAAGAFVVARRRQGWWLLAGVVVLMLLGIAAWRWHRRHTPNGGSGVRCRAAGAGARRNRWPPRRTCCVACRAPRVARGPTGWKAGLALRFLDGSEQGSAPSAKGPGRLLLDGGYRRRTVDAPGTGSGARRGAARVFLELDGGKAMSLSLPVPRGGCGTATPATALGRGHGWRSPLPWLVRWAMPPRRAQADALRGALRPCRTGDRRAVGVAWLGRSALAWLVGSCCASPWRRPQQFGDAVTPPASRRDLMLAVDLSARHDHCPTWSWVARSWTG